MPRVRLFENVDVWPWPAGSLDVVLVDVVHWHELRRASERAQGYRQGRGPGTRCSCRRRRRRPAAAILRAHRELRDEDSGSVLCPWCDDDGSVERTAQSALIA